MKIIICGAGQVGMGIAQKLSTEGNDVSMIDTSAELVQQANDMLDVRAVQGHGAHPDTLIKAGAKDADMMIAVTLSDEVNMVACQVAHTLFDIPTKIARVRAQSYLSEDCSKLMSRSGLSIDYVISPEIEVGESVLRRLELPGAFETVALAEGRVMVLGITCGVDCPVIDTPLSQLTELFPDLPATVVGIVRGGRMLVPDKSEHMLAGDEAYVAVPKDEVARTLKIFGHEETKARRVVIAGGGNIGLYVARAIEKHQSNVRLKIIELSRKRAVEIADKLDRTVVLHGSALSEDLLREAEVQSAQTMVALTNDDQVNILSSVLARQLGCQRSMCLINSSGYNTMIRSFGIDAQINPRGITVSRVLQYVRRGRIRGVQSIHDGAAEVIEGEALDTAKVVGRRIDELGLGEGVRIGAVLRGQTVLRPTAELEIKARDRLVLFARSDKVRIVEQLLRVAPDYF